MNIVRGFKEFIVRGNVIDLAVGIVMGAAFGAVVNSFVNSFIAPLVKLATGGKAVSGTWRVKDAVFDWGGFINAVITFLLTAAAVYFFVVVPINRLNRRRRAEEEAQLSDEARLLTEIRDELRTR
ncbi:large conductance mechanosensitive channel protein MscL [Luedemannella helvata]|uniref:Large-conductance mechanosensitive channel n=1 Tax=Luedemannella helvata TaxID=349315 RepID=A0ABN2JQT8_9ACTN